MKKILQWSILITVVFLFACSSSPEEQLAKEIEGTAIAGQAINFDQPYRCSKTAHTCEDNGDGTITVTSKGDAVIQAESCHRGKAYEYVCNRKRLAMCNQVCADGCDAETLSCVDEPDCRPRECLWQEYAGGVMECGEVDDGCGGTMRCGFEAFAGGEDCQEGYSCVENQCQADVQEFEGCAEPSHSVRLFQHGDRYELSFTALSSQGQQNRVDLPLAYPNEGKLFLGEKNWDNLAQEPSKVVTDDDYFVLASSGARDSLPTVLQYVSSKNSGDSIQTAKFKDLHTGETFERTFSDDCEFDINKDGTTHNFGAVGDCLSDNWDIQLVSEDFASMFNPDTYESTTHFRDSSGALVKIVTQDRANEEGSPGAARRAVTVQVERGGDVETKYKLGISDGQLLLDRQVSHEGACEIDQMCVEGECQPLEREDVCVPRECLWQSYAGGIRECGDVPDGCGGTINCAQHEYAGGALCPVGMECRGNSCEEPLAGQVNDMASQACNVPIQVGDFIKVETQDQRLLTTYIRSSPATQDDPWARFRGFQEQNVDDTHVELRAVFDLNRQGTSYKFHSHGSYEVDNFGIQLIHPCNQVGLECNQLVEQHDDFQLGEENFRYMGANGGIQPIQNVSIWDVDANEDLQRTWGLFGVASLGQGSDTFIFESDAQFDSHDYTIQLVNHCPAG